MGSKALSRRLLVWPSYQLGAARTNRRVVNESGINSASSSGDALKEPPHER
jgi:hypothetical protein